MAIHLAAKGPDDVPLYEWKPSFYDGAYAESYTLSASGGTVDAESLTDGLILFYVSGGTAGEVITITATAVSESGEEAAETLYVPVRADTREAATTARDVVDFAMRKITGLGETAEAAEAEDALEQLNDMLAMWRIDGLDLGLGKLALGDTLYIADEFVAAVKFSLRVACHEFYGQALTNYDVSMAQDGKRLVRNKLFTTPQLGFSDTLVRRVNDVADLF